MSASSTRRRLSLLTGNSLAAALAVAGAGGISLMPAPASAANECGNPAANGATADTFVCTGSQAAITYPATDGNLTLQLRANVTTTTGGLVVTPTGTNTVTISRVVDNPANTGDPSLTSTSATTAALQVTRATGGTITVNLSDNDASFGVQDSDAPMVVSGLAAGVRLQNAGTSATSLTTTNGAITASAGAGIEMSTSGTGTITIANGATVTGTTASILVASGAGVTITNDFNGVLKGAVTLNNTGATSFTNHGAWAATGASALGGGASTLTTSPTAVVAAAGETEDAATLTLSGLETWNNAGWVLFGANEELTGSDGVANDRIVSTATTFTGSGGSTLAMDVDFSSDQQDCSAAITADCLDLRGSSTAGVTGIVVRRVGEGMSMAERIVLVDVAGAGTDAGVFSLDATSAGYRDLQGGVIDGGLFLYALEHDAAAKQHALVAVAADGEAFEVALVPRQASEPWRTATGMWHDRQADLRNTLSAGGEGYAPGAWLKVAGNFIDESRVDTLTLGADSVGFDTAYAQETTAIVGGVDVLRFVGANTAWVLGLTGGRVDSAVDFAAGRSRVDLEGPSLGAYASFLAGPAYVDAVVNTTDLDLTHTGFGAEFEGAAKSFGYQLEGGYRLFQIVNDGAWLEPLASLSYVETTVEDLDMGAAVTRFDDAASLRAALGVRAGGDLVTEALTARFSATGRLWKEFEGDQASSLSAAFGDTVLLDEGVDRLGDIGVAVSLFALDGRLSAHLAYNVLFREDYQNTGASFGLRYNW